MTESTDTQKTFRYPQTILASAVIPWCEDFSFDRELQHLIDHYITHIYIFGTAGEGYAVSDGQFEEIVTVFSDYMKLPGVCPIVGIINMSTTTIMERIAFAYEKGIRDFMISLPSWGGLSTLEMKAFFHYVCDQFSDCSFTNYNLPRTKRLIEVSEFIEIANEIPNLVAVKFSTFDARVIRDMGESDCGLRFFVHDLSLKDANELGECGWLISLGVSNLKRAGEYFKATIEKDHATANKYWSELLQFHKGFSMPSESSRIDGWYDKMIIKLAIPEFPLRLLPPYKGADKREFEIFQNHIQQNCPQWSREIL